MHKTLSKKIFFKRFSEEVIFIYKTICDLKPFEKPDYDKYIKILNSAKFKIIKKKKKPKIWFGNKIRRDL